MKNSRYKEKVIETLLHFSGFIAVLILFLICIFLFRDGIALFHEYPLINFLTGTKWYPTSLPHQFGLLPLLFGSIIVTFGAIVFSVPLGIVVAIYISEIAGKNEAEILKPFIELLAGIPSVVYGFFGLVVLVPFIQNIFGLPTGQTALAGSIMLGIMALPTIISISEDAISSVPRTIKEGSLALGATEWQTIYKVTLPAALSGISAAVMLGVGRAIGETMTVMMVTGNSAVIPGFPDGIFAPVRTMTAAIALEMGEVPQGSDHFHALFAIGSILFITTLITNIVAEYIKRKYKFNMGIGQ
jgi:phosphate transport system permease protein